MIYIKRVIWKEERGCKNEIGNYIGDEGSVVISKGLITNSTLTTLDLGCDKQQKQMGKRKRKWRK